jgi:transposase
VIGWEQRVLLRHYLEQGLTKTALAEQFGLSRQTIYRWIKSGELDRDLNAETVRYKARPPQPTKLDPYKDIILTRLQEFPKLTAMRLFQEVQAAGYPGSYTQVKVYVRKVRPRPPSEPLVRFETPPGHQAQVDLAHFSLPWGRRYALIVVLGYSRLLWLRFVPKQDMNTLFRGLEAAFEFFGGVPTEILFDQMKSVIIKDLCYDGGPLVENPEFLRFAHHWGFRPRACRPYRAKTKGKVERPIRYLRESFFYGRTFTSDSDLNHQAEHWLTTVANVRTHATLKQRPIDRFAEEKNLLRPLASRPYRSLVLSRSTAPAPQRRPSVPRVLVEHRPLEQYAQIAGGG